MVIMKEKQDRLDFFISYTEKDQRWAEWIARQLEEAGYTVFIQAWDVRPGANFVEQMDTAARNAERTLLVLSAAYLRSECGFAEWAAAFRRDPRGIHRRLLPVRIEPCEVEGLLGPVVFIDLVGQQEEEQARERLLAGVKRERAKPATVAFPRQATPSTPSVAFPGSRTGLWTVPYLRNPHFTGREELLDQLTQQLAPQTQEQRTTTRRAALTQPQAIKGLGGIGKTQIAVEYAYRAREQGRYTHTLWINAASEEAILADLSQLAEQLPSFPAQAETDQRKLAKAVIGWLEQCQESWLLLFDNADEVAVLPDYLPQHGNGSILLTTRSQAVGALAASIEVDNLGLVAGTQLLLHRAQRQRASEDEWNEATNVVIALESFPLALDQAGAYIEETGCSCADYLQIYQEHRQALLARRGRQATNYPDSVATTWTLSFQKVQQANPAAAELLELCSFLAPDRIPEELLTEGAACWPAPLQQAVADSFQFQQLLADLLRFSLIKRLAEEHALSLHRLVQAVQIDRMEPETRRQWAERVVRAVNKVFPGRPQDIETWPQCLRYLDQAQACSVLVEQYALSLIEAARLLNRVGYYFKEHALYALTEPLYVRALTICQQQLGARHPDTATNLDNLAGLYQIQGKYERAERLYRSALKIREQVLGGMHPDTAASLNNLAALYDDQGRYQDAEALYRRALELNKQQLRATSLSIAHSLNNLALLCGKQQRYEEAEPWYLQALEIYERELEEMDPSLAQCVNNLADLYERQGRAQEAEPLFRRALDIREKALGPEHLDTAQSLWRLAVLAQRQQRFLEARSLYERALAIYQRTLGPEHHRTQSLQRDYESFLRTTPQEGETGD
jgi:tetratricopeptide (TPR) repeat protein